MSNRSSSPEPAGWDADATARYFAAEAEKKRKDEAERAAAAAAEAARLAKNTDMQSLDGGARARTTRTKKMKRRHKRKLHRKSKRVIKR